MINSSKISKVDWRFGNSKDVDSMSLTIAKFWTYVDIELVFNWIWGFGWMWKPMQNQHGHISREIVIDNEWRNDQYFYVAKIHSSTDHAKKQCIRYHKILDNSLILVKMCKRYLLYFWRFEKYTDSILTRPFTIWLFNIAMV